MWIYTQIVDKSVDNLCISCDYPVDKWQGWYYCGYIFGYKCGYNCGHIVPCG